jgi:TRAP-type C4-dicarboxylate transport system substrate-binding protein
LLRFAEERSADHPSAEASGEFARIVGRESDGDLLVRIYYEGRLGDEDAVAEQLRFGGIDLARLQARALDSISPAAARLGAPGRFPTEASLTEAMEGNEGRALAEELVEERLILLAWYDGGPDCRLLPPSHASSDFNGLRIGVDPSRSAMALVAAAGGTPVPLALRDFRRAREADRVDGFYLPLLSATSERLLDTLAATPVLNSRSLELVVASRSTFMQLHPSDRELIIRAAAASTILQKDFRYIAETRAIDAATGGRR